MENLKLCGYISRSCAAMGAQCINKFAYNVLPSFLVTIYPGSMFHFFLNSYVILIGIDFVLIQPCIQRLILVISNIYVLNNSYVIYFTSNYTNSSSIRQQIRHSCLDARAYYVITPNSKKNHPKKLSFSREKRMFQGRYLSKTDSQDVESLEVLRD